MRRFCVTSASCCGRSLAWRARTSPSVCAFHSIRINGVRSTFPGGNVVLTPFLAFPHPLSRSQLFFDGFDLRLTRALRIELDAAVDRPLAETHGERRRLEDALG